jgi:hypothetical protein
VRAARRWAIAAGAPLLALGSACSSAPSPAGPDASDDAIESSDAGPVLTYLPTYTAVWTELLQPTCALVFCHAGSSDYLEMTSKDGAYAALVNAPAAGPSCAPTGLDRITPGHPEASLLYLKITTPPCGDMMPLQYGARVVLDPRQIAQVHDWITAGAPND